LGILADATELAVALQRQQAVVITSYGEWVVDWPFHQAQLR
jgi:hypothetical protein